MNKCPVCGANCEGKACWRHKSRKPLKKSSIMHKKRDNAGNNPQMKDFFLEIWRKRPVHECEMCGKWLGNEPLSYMFDHLLEKSSYPELKYEEENIAYLCLECHDKKTRGFASEEYLNKIQQVKIKYGLS